MRQDYTSLLYELRCPLNAGCPFNLSHYRLTVFFYHNPSLLTSSSPVSEKNIIKLEYFNTVHQMNETLYVCGRIIIHRSGWFSEFWSVFPRFWTSKIQTWYATEAWTFIDEVWILPFFVHFQWNGSTVIELKLSGCFPKAYRHSDLKLGSTQRAQCDAYQLVSCAKPSTSLSLGALVHFQRNSRFCSVYITFFYTDQTHVGHLFRIQSGSLFDSCLSPFSRNVIY